MINLLLAADIGGTNARFVAAEPDSGLIVARVDYTSVSGSTGMELVRQACKELAIVPLACSVAVAGPVSAGKGGLTNGTLEFDALALSCDLACPVLVLNDFVAIASALPVLTDSRAIGGGMGLPLAVKAVIGPGTGLGMSFVVPPAGVRAGVDADDVDTPWLVHASEGGNADFAPADALEQELLVVLRSRFDNVSWETLVSGPGLVNLYCALSTLWGTRPEYTMPEEITAQGLEMSDPLCHQCLETFCKVLGSAAANLALTVHARGGVFLAGSLALHLAEMIDAGSFRRRFEDRGAMAALAREIPTRLITETDAGLIGAIRQAQAMVR